MYSIGAALRNTHVVNRGSLFEDVIQLHQQTQEFLVDAGGITRDMYSSFWEKTYYSYFDGTGVVVPLMYAQIKMEIFVTLGTIISHGYLASGYLLIRIALPTLIWVQLLTFPS